MARLVLEKWDMDSPEAPRPLLYGIGLRLAATLGVLSVLLGVLLGAVRPWYLDWGSADEDRRRALPGDDLAHHSINQTRAIDIHAPAATVFAWVSQLGQNRAGFYSYTVLENLVGCEMPDVRHLDPALQRWTVGDKLWMYPASKLDGMGHATLLYYEPGRALVFGTNTPIDPPGSAPTGTWSFIVEPTSEQSARLLVRGSGGSMASLLGRAYTRAVFEPLHFAMERRMLEGIKGLAEGDPIPKGRDALQLIAWASAFASFIAAAGLVVFGRRPRRGLLGFAASGVTFQILTLVQPMPVVSVALVIVLILLLWPLTRDRTARASAREMSRAP
jgi:hypothetical protein